MQVAMENIVVNCHCKQMEQLC